ncbi:zinc finger BED domain-containing protein RICESLEEPER 1-like [Henckelia pumila]|uniref:zinc finger BED domain-containing protein RICESLEEPER 1-like n=1 Tax=Henckelia pumila TaxID=405737 RepID=UPI003C6DD282
MWKSKNQKIEYMVVTGHLIDDEWKFQKRVLKFVHIPPPRRGLQISDVIFKCVKDWGIQNKTCSISVDNSSNNDSAIRLLKDNFSRTNKFLCDGKLFHVRCCAYVLNFMVQDGLSEIVDIIKNKRMLICALKFREVFPQFADRDAHYDCCPSLEDWNKVEKECSILQYFWTTTQNISGSEYPASNLFLKEVQKIKMMLARIADAKNVKCKILLLKNVFECECPKKKIREVNKALYDLYDEYVTANTLVKREHSSGNPVGGDGQLEEDWDEYIKTNHG